MLILPENHNMNACTYEEVEFPKLLYEVQQNPLLGA
jgi:hypothetical protein